VASHDQHSAIAEHSTSSNPRSHQSHRHIPFLPPLYALRRRARLPRPGRTPPRLCTLSVTPYGVRRQSEAATALLLIQARTLTPKRRPPKAFGCSRTPHISQWMPVVLISLFHSLHSTAPPYYPPGHSNIMPRISEIWRTRLLFIGLLLLSLVPVLLHQMLRAREIYEIHYVGGLHPMDLQMLRWIGQLSIVCPAIFICVLLASTIHPNPALARLFLAISVAVFLIYLILFLWWAVLVIQLRVPVL
jgi:hypothetical protein